MRVDSDEKLTVRAAKGDEDAFEELVRRYQRPVYNAAYRIARDPDDAADISQTVFIKAYRKLGTFDPSRKFFSWLYRIAVNESINFVKRKNRSFSVEGDLGESRSSPASDYAQIEAGDQIQRALVQLKLEYRIVVVLKYFLQLSYAEICEIAGIPEKTDKSRLFTARKQLREILIGQGYAK